jgi:signal transduction histidine kinase
MKNTKPVMEFSVNIITMNMLRYENIWLRNFILLCSLDLLAFIDSQVLPETESCAFYWTFLEVLAFYLMVFVHNAFLLKHFFFLEKNVKLYIMLSVVYILTISWAFNQISHTRFPQDKTPFFSELIGVLSAISLGIGFYFANNWVLENLINSKKRILNTETELAQLKQQMNPHFLLNSLNNLYGVALSTPEKVPSKILELSDLLTYQIETSKKEWIPLRDEMKFANDYLRYMEWKTNGMKVKIHVNGEVRDYKITPMIFLPLLENAVKYAAETSEPTISVEWTFGKNSLQIDVRSNFHIGLSKVKSTKTGIENLRRRLELYHPHHELMLFKEEGTFRSQLELWKLTTAA